MIMAIITESTTPIPPRPFHLKEGICICCQRKKGSPKYGLYVCPECDKRIFIDPYGGHTDANVPICSIDAKVDPTGTPYKKISIIYRFDRGDTLISIVDQDNWSRPLLTFPTLMPNTPEFIAKIPQNLQLWVTFS